MEKKQVLFIIDIQKKATKKESSGQLDTKSIQKDRQKRYARSMYREEIRRAFMSGWQQALQHGQNIEKNKQIDAKKEEIRPRG